MAEPANRSDETPLSYARLSKPRARLYHETAEQLEEQALAAALDNARGKFESTARRACGIGDYQVLSFVENSAGGGPPIPYGRSAAAPQESNATLEFDSIWITKQLEVTFLAKSGTCSVSK